MTASRGSARARRRAMQVVLSVVAALLPVAAVAQAGDASRALQGKWRVEFKLDITDERHVPTAREATGEIAFDSTSWWAHGDRFGRHSLDLRAFFGRSFALPAGVQPFGPADTSITSEVSGIVTGQALTIDFMPRVGRFGVSMRGRFYGDSAVGDWHRRGMDGSGQFVMRRVSSEPVRVAAINDPASNAAATVAAKPATPARSKGAAKATTAKGGEAKPAATQARGSAAKPAAAPPAKAVAAAQPAPPPVARVVQASAGPAATAAAPVVQAAQPTAAPAAAAAGPAAAGNAGQLRVRMFDRASKRWFATAYQLQLGSGQWLWGDMKSGDGADGWGPAVQRPVGSHRVVVDNFVCGDKFWFFARPVVQPVEIRPGETAEVTIEVDLSAAPAKKTYDNPKGVPCAAGPGAKD